MTAVFVVQCGIVDCKDVETHVPTVRVSAVKLIHVLPHCCVAAQIEVTGITDSTGAWLVEPEKLDGFQVQESLLHLCNEDNPNIVVVNSTGFTQTLPLGTRVAKAMKLSLYHSGK